MITLTREAWKKFASGCPQAWAEALFGNLDLLTAHGILENEYRWCHFAATVYAETGNFRELRENLNYRTANALRRAWPSRFGHLTDAQCRPYLRNPRALAAKVYNGRMGNRPGSSDGYDFRGGGWIQTTGREQVEAYCKELGITPGPTTLDDPVITLQFAVLEWTAAKCNEWADENDIRKIAKAINTGSADSNIQPNGMSNRIAAFALAWKYWGEYGTADKPAKSVGVKEYGTLTTAAVVATQGAHAAVQSISTADPIDLAEKAVTTGSRVRSVAQQGHDLASSALSLPHWPIVVAAFALAGGLYWVLCHWLPSKQGSPS
jgi:predicted chitinase